MGYAINRQGVTGGNAVTLLPGGYGAFPAMLDDIAAARHTVYLESYIFHGDATGRAFLAALAAAARRGCEVRLLCDGVGSLGLPASLLSTLEESGAQTLIYRPVSPFRARWGVWRRDHRKILVIDERIGFLGGLNIGDEYDDRIQPDRTWRDLHLRIEGPAAPRLARLFRRTWNAEAVPARRLRIPRGRPARVTRGEPVPPTAIVIIGNREWRHRSLIRRSFLHALRRARRTVFIANPYFIPDAPIARALRAAARRGVDVRVIVPERSDILVCDLAARATFGKLLADGVRIAEWRAGMMHAKAACIDGLWATVGSYNFDRRSLLYNLEVTANVFDAALATQLEILLRSDFDASREIDAADFANRSLMQRLVEWFAYLLRAWL